MEANNLEIGEYMPHTGSAWLSSARVVRCWVKSRNERNPRRQLPSLGWGLWRDCRCKSEEGGDDVKSACPLCPGPHTCYNGRYREIRRREAEGIPQRRPQFRPKSAIRLREGGITSNRGSACRGEYVPGVCTHRPSNHERWQRLKPLSQPQGGRRLGRGC